MNPSYGNASLPFASFRAELEAQTGMEETLGMFTGLIEAVTEVRGRAESRLRIAKPKSFDDIRIGSSICVSGVCLTVADLSDDEMGFDLTGETLARTTLGSLRRGDRVNLERSMKADARLEGHVVQGHVEGTGTIANCKLPFDSAQDRQIANGGDAYIEVELPNSLLPYVVPKGSVAIDGVSLTVARVEGNTVTVALIPHTIANTTLGALKPGDRVNIETDVLLRHAHQMANGKTCPEPDEGWEIANEK